MGGYIAPIAGLPEWARTNTLLAGWGKQNGGWRLRVEGMEVVRERAVSDKCRQAVPRAGGV